MTLFSPVNLCKCKQMMTVIFALIVTFIVGKLRRQTLIFELNVPMLRFKTWHSCSL
jgi:hypothetical protein